MNTKGLADYAEGVYRATMTLFDLVPEDKLDWRPSDKNNWWTTSQLLMHLTTATGVCMKGFITGEWPEMPEFEGCEEGVLPPAEVFPTVASVAEAKRMLEEDRKLAATQLAELSDDDFSNKIVTAPWDPRPLPLWNQLLMSVEHQISHKTTLFGYLKLLGVDVNTGHLYGM